MTRTDALTEVLGQAQDLGFVGPGPLSPHRRQAEAVATTLGDGPGRVADLGPGGGLPSLPAALARPAWSWVLLEAQLRRADFLRQAVRRLALGDRVEVRHVRAEAAGRALDLRGTCDAVVARAFGPPAVVAECAAPLLRVGGRLVVSDPPEAGAGRWPPDALADLGLGTPRPVDVDGFHLTVLAQASPCPDRFPRRPGIPERQPLF